MTLYDLRLLTAIDMIRKGDLRLLALCELTEGERALCDAFEDQLDGLQARLDYTLDNQRALGQAMDNLSAEKRNIERKLGL